MRHFRQGEVCRYRAHCATHCASRPGNIGLNCTRCEYNARVRLAGNVLIDNQRPPASCCRCTNPHGARSRDGGKITVSGVEICPFVGAGPEVVNVIASRAQGPDFSRTTRSAVDVPLLVRNRSSEAIGRQPGYLPQRQEFGRYCGIEYRRNLQTKCRPIGPRNRPSFAYPWSRSLNAQAIASS